MDLDEKVNAAIVDGWECIGGVQYVACQMPTGRHHAAMQGMTIPADRFAENERRAEDARAKAAKADTAAALVQAEKPVDPIPANPTPAVQEPTVVGPNQASVQWNQPEGKHKGKR